MVVYLWSRPNYGSNEHPIMIYLPHSGCSFEEALDCIMLAFHHTEIPELIEIIKPFLNKTKGLATSQQFLDHPTTKGGPLNDYLMKLKEVDDCYSVGRIYDIISISMREDNQLENHQLIKKLLFWAKDYAKKILQQLSILLSVFMSQFLSKFCVINRSALVIVDQMGATGSKLTKDDLPKGTVMGLSYHSKSLMEDIKLGHSDKEVMVFKGELKDDEVVSYLNLLNKNGEKEGLSSILKDTLITLIQSRNNGSSLGFR